MSENTKTAKAATTPTESDLRTKAYNAATRTLRAKYRNEFTALVTEEATKLGVTYKPRPTPEEKAEQKLQALLAEHPELAAKFGAASGADAEAEQGTPQG